jgi:hypothetical protein
LTGGSLGPKPPAYRSERFLEMPNTGSYCKAYYVADLKKFPGWDLFARKTRVEKQERDGDVVSTERDLQDEDYLFVQENFIVTDGIFIDENIIFENVTDEWREFCAQTLGFRAPEYCAAAPTLSTSAV